MRAAVVPDDYKIIASRFAHPYDVRLLYPFRFQLKFSADRVAEKLNIRREYLCNYERMNAMMPIEIYTDAEALYITEILTRGLITPKAHASIMEQKKHRIHAAARMLKLSMSPSELLKWKRSVIRLRNMDVARLFHCSKSTVDRLFRGDITSEERRMFTSILTRMEQQTLEAMNYEIYN